MIGLYIPVVVKTPKFLNITSLMNTTVKPSKSRNMLD